MSGTIDQFNSFHLQESHFTDHVWTSARKLDFTLLNRSKSMETPSIDLSQRLRNRTLITSTYSNILFFLSLDLIFFFFLFSYQVSPPFQRPAEPSSRGERAKRKEADQISSVATWPLLFQFPFPSLYCRGNDGDSGLAD